MSPNAAAAPSATTDGSLAELAQRLHAPADKLGFLAVLAPAARTQLAADIEQAHAAHAAHIKGRMTEALDHLPWLLRAPMKKLFGV